MPFDADTIFYDGSTFFKYNNETPAVTTVRDGYGKRVLDIRETGVKGLAAVMLVPLANVSYGNTLDAFIEHSDRPEFNWEGLAMFPRIYTYIRRVPAKTTTPPVEADVGKYLYGGTTNDDGIITHFAPELYVANGVGYIEIAMVAAGDVFDNTSEALTVKAEAAGGGASGTFVGVVNGVAADAPDSIQHSGIYVVRFATKKRYLRFHGNCLPGGNGANFHGIRVFLTPYPYETI